MDRSAVETLLDLMETRLSLLAALLWQIATATDPTRRTKACARARVLLRDTIAALAYNSARLRTGRPLGDSQARVTYPSDADVRDEIQYLMGR
ncbi:MAG: hypothetical protein AB7Y46_01655 [Armatimonadota bacterium]